MIDVIIFCALIIGFAVIVAGAASYILEREEERERAWNKLHERERLIDEVIQEIERRSHEH